MKFYVYGTPIAQPRPRACMRGNHAGVYDDRSADSWKDLIRFAAIKNAPETPFTGAVKLQCTFFLPRPKKHFLPANKSRLQPVLRLDAPMWHTAKPDMDNYVKAVMDALTNSGVMWLDDSQVALLDSAKTYETALHKCGVEIVLEEETNVK